MQIFIEHWGGGEFAILPQFWPIFNIGGDEPQPRFFQVSKLSEDQKKKQKQVFIKNGNLFFPNWSGDLRSDAHQSQIIGGDADEDHTQIIGGGDTVKLLRGNISPPGFGTPESNYADQTQCLYSAVVRSVTTPLACQTKCRIKKIARFSTFKAVFCIGIDSKMI